MANEYWEDRKDFQYYKQVVQFCKTYAEDAHSVIDVGNSGTEYILDLDWIPDKSVLDKDLVLKDPSVTTHKANFFRWKPPCKYDVVLCLQVLEHLEAADVFVHKLFSISSGIIVLAVPYKWPKGTNIHHCQDPVDEEKLRFWTEQDPIDQEVVTEPDGYARLVAVYQGV